MNKATCLALTIFSLLTNFLSAQLTVDAEIRPRAEYRHGFKALANQDQDAAFFIDQRSRINLGFMGSRTEVYVTLQDVRTWGNQPQLVISNGATTGIHQAWAKVKLDDQWAMKLGRQQIDLDDQRIFGSVGWAQQARSHDAGLLVYQDSSLTGQLGLAFNQNSPQLIGTSYSIPNNYKTIQYLWLHKDWERLNGSFLFLNNGVQVDFANGESGTNFSQTIGGRLGYTQNKFTSHLAVYYQGGTDADTLGRKVNAFYLGWDASLRFEKNVTLGLGTEILSGNSQLDNNGENNAFTPLYGTNHKFNGLMDYFYVGNHLGSVGLNDFFAKASYDKNRFGTSFAFHYFISNSDIVNPEKPETVAAAYLGSEFDFVMGWKLKSGVALKMGYSQMFGSESMELIRGGDRAATSNWMWVMVTVRPSFIFKNN